MFEPDNEGYGLYGFNPHSLDPQATNAINTELVTLLQPLLASGKKARTQEGQQIREITERLLRQTFLKLEGVPPLEELLLNDFNCFGYN